MSEKNVSKMKKLFYIDRATGKKEQEIIYGERELNFLYFHKLGKRLRLPLVRGSWFSHINALPKKMWYSRKKIASFVESYDINVEEAEKPLKAYRNLDEFFTRKLKRGVRKVCKESSTLVSPADGRIMAHAIDDGLELQVKGQKVSLETLLGSQQQAQELIGGSAVVVRLAPKDYHRTHFPVDGLAKEPYSVKGPLESVHPLALNAGALSFENKRTITKVHSLGFGPVYIIDVGALTVGTIIQTYKAGIVHKGDEKGYFRFGGSTVILLWGKNGPTIDSDIVANSRQGLETLVQFGSNIAKKKL